MATHRFRWLASPLCALAGAASHVALDHLTHEWGWFARNVDWYSAVLAHDVLGREWTVFRTVQYAGHVVGTAACLWLPASYGRRGWMTDRAAAVTPFHEQPARAGNGDRHRRDARHRLGGRRSQRLGHRHPAREWRHLRRAHHRLPCSRHLVAHGLPLAPAGEGRRWSSSNGIEHGFELGDKLARQAVEVVDRRDGTLIVIVGMPLEEVDEPWLRLHDMRLTSKRFMRRGGGSA
jgi:hypothetical protein